MYIYICIKIGISVYVFLLYLYSLLYWNLIITHVHYNILHSHTVIHILVIHSRTRNTQMFSRIMDPEVSSPFPKLEPNMLEPQTCCLWSVSSGCLAWQALHVVTL